MKIEIKSTLKTERLGNRLWVLLDPFTICICDIEYIIPSGFVTDGASCPRMFWSICSPIAGPFGEASVLHDYLFNEGPDIGQFNADKILYYIGRYRGSGFIRAKMVKAGVNSFGWMSYKKNINKVTEKTCYDFAYAVERIKFLRDKYIQPILQQA